jgi:hypothetical protein
MTTTRTTIPKHRVADFLKKVTSAKAYTLGNYFNGEPILDLDRMRDSAIRHQGKVRIVKAEHKGQIYFHSNYWVEFEYAELTPAKGQR